MSSVYYLKQNSIFCLSKLALYFFPSFMRSYWKRYITHLGLRVFPKYDIYGKLVKTCVEKLATIDCYKSTQPQLQQPNRFRKFQNFGKNWTFGLPYNLRSIWETLKETKYKGWFPMTLLLLENHYHRKILENTLFTHVKNVISFL